MIRLLINFTATSIIGICFIYSAWAKSKPISIFANSILELGISDWRASLLIAHSIVSIEFILGFLFLFRYYTGKKLILLTASFVTILSFILIYQMVFFPELKDCGCFGTKLALSPLQSLLKNLFLITCCIYLYSSERTKNTKSLIFLSLIAIISLVYPIFRNDWVTNNKQNNYKFNFSLFDFKKTSDTNSINNGKWLLACLSSSCNHCKESIKKLGNIRRRNPKIPIYLIVLSEKNNVDSFLNANNSGNIQYTYTNDINKVISVSFGKVPSFFWLNNGVVEKRTTNHKELTLYDLEKWLDN